jgi:ParB family chromosome partitioning protein
MTFKTSAMQYQMLALDLIEPDPAQPRRNIDEAGLKGLANSIAKKGLIHPLVVQPANAAGKYQLIVGERRWRAAQLAGESSVPALIRACPADEALEVRVFENLGLGLRSALEPRDMANAIQHIAERFASQEEAAEHFARSPTWLSQATAAANLSPKVSALLDAGKITSTGTAVRLEKLVQKNEAKAESLIGQIEQLPEGEKLPAKVVEQALSTESRRKKKEDEADAASPLPAEMPAAGTQLAEPMPTAPATLTAPATVPPSEEAPAALPVPAVVTNRRVNPGKVQMVARILGLSDDDEDEILDRLIDEFLALKGEGNPPF